MVDGDDAPVPSRSERKREHRALQALGKALFALSEPERARLSLPEPVREALNDARRIPASSARERQFRYLGKLLAQTDHAAIQTALHRVQQRDQRQKAVFHRLEQWRDRLVAEGDPAITALLDEAPELDRQPLRQLVRQARKAGPEGNPAPSRKLFRYLRDTLAERWLDASGPPNA